MRLQDPTSVPTPLGHERVPIEIVESRPSDPFRVVRTLAFVVHVAAFWWWTSLSIFFSRTVDTRARAIRLRLFIEEMGGIWIKAAQLAALRRDVFVAETCDELAKLQDRSKGFPFEDAKRIIENELGVPLEVVYSEFEEVPIAAASIGQTYVARLRENGVKVAVKVQRPYISQRVAQDIRYVKFVTTWFMRLGVALEVRWDELVWELERTLSDEFDYRIEGASVGRMRKSLKRHGIYVPKVFSRYCTRKILTLEFIEGTFMSDFIAVSRSDPTRVQRWLADNCIDPKLLARRMLISHLRQVFEDELYHADLHPGNIVLQRDSRFALVDFGSVGMLDRGQRQRYRLMIRSLAEHDYSKAADMLLVLAPPLPNSDIATFKLLLMRTCRAWIARTYVKGIPYHEKSFAGFFSQALQHFQTFKISADWAFLRINRAGMTLDASVAFLDSDIDYPKVARRYEQVASRRARKAVMRGLDVTGTAHDLVRAVKQWTENLDFDGEWIRKRSMDFQGRIGKFAAASQALISAFSWGLVILGLGVMVRHHRLGEHASIFQPIGQLLQGFHPIDLVLLAALGVVFVGRRVFAARRHFVAREFERPWDR